MTRYIMKCGHADNGFDKKTGKRCCVMCGCFDIEQEIKTGSEGLEGRTAVCTYCHETRPSSWYLPLFEFRPKKDQDSFYCGCRGWD